MVRGGYVIYPRSLREYGRPFDCLGWRQFIFERQCPARTRRYGVARSIVAVLPCLVWVRDHQPPARCICGAPVYVFSGRAELRAAAGLPPPSDGCGGCLCGSMGSFVE